MTRTNKLIIIVVTFVVTLGCSFPSSTIATRIPTTTVTTTPTFVASTATVTDPILGTFAVIASRLYIRDREGEVIGYFEQGETLTCLLTDSGWCLLEQGRRVWSGCLEPNEYNLGCEAK